jgi:hypothetical protein
LLLTGPASWSVAIYDETGVVKAESGRDGVVTYFGLYYPFIHFKDEGWLKLTALYWDGMKRIVPSGAALRDTDEVKRLIDAEIVQNESPNLGASSISQPFRDLVAEHGDTLRAQLGVDGSADWPDDPYTRLHAPP